MMFIKSILALSFAVLALAAPPPPPAKGGKPLSGDVEVDLVGADLLDVAL